jgi:CheY-like chemotaxis protein
MNRGNTTDVLFVDDDRGFMATAQQLLLKNQGGRFSITWAHNGRSALEELEKNPKIQLIRYPRDAAEADLLAHHSTHLTT